jgi:hypothetical protein
VDRESFIELEAPAMRDPGFRGDRLSPRSAAHAAPAELRRKVERELRVSPGHDFTVRDLIGRCIARGPDMDRDTLTAARKPALAASTSATPAAGPGTWTAAPQIDRPPPFTMRSVQQT